MHTHTNVEPGGPDPSCAPAAGFTPGARELFRQENHLALYQLPEDAHQDSGPRRAQVFIKRQLPISHLISLLVKDSSSSE